MCRYIETIRLVEGRIANLSYHNARLNATRRSMWPGCSLLKLEEFLEEVPFSFQPMKGRVLYDASGFVEKSFRPYEKRHINSLKIVVDNDISYPFKSEDRGPINNLLLRKEECDEILIVKNGLLTDTSYTNIALFDGNRWLTPATPLLKGTMRASLIESGRISEENLYADRLYEYRFVSMFNAMIDLGEIVLPVSQVF